MENSVIRLNLDLNNICRICLGEGGNNTDLFSENAKSADILHMISQCFQIILKADKYLPCVICKDCFEDLKKAYNFRAKCMTINERFKDYCEMLLKHTEDDVKSVVLQEYEDDNIPSVTDNSPVCESSDAVGSIDKVAVFKCDICQKVLKSMESLLKHVVRMHEKRKHVGKVSGYGSSRRYHCTTCSYSTPHSQTLVNHMRRHNGERPFVCECGKRFTQASSLASHRKIHSTISYFTCSLCGKQFKHAYSLKTHFRVHDNGKFNCSICRKVLKSKETLHIHMKRHYRVYNYNCEDCGDTFVTPAELNNHRLKHNFEKNFECHICGYKSNMKKSLAMHIKRHVGDRAFKCSFCDKAFYTHGDLRRHLRVHTREKPFSCQMCAQRFTYSSSLNKHMLTVHGIQYRWGDVKSKELLIQKHSSKISS